MGWLRNRQIWKQIFLGLLLLGLWLGIKQLPLRENVAEFAAWVRAQGMLGLAAFWGAYILATLTFLPVSVLNLSAGAIFGPTQGLALTMASAVSGATTSFLVARHIARDRVAERAASNERFCVLDSIIGERDWKIVCLLRLSILIPFHISNYVLGVTRIRFWPYLAASAIGMAPGTFVYVYLGHLGQTTILKRDTLHPLQLGLIIGGLLVTVTISVFLAKFAKRKLAESRAQCDNAERLNE
ncbi:MAG TPA: TVP38/TMEM64 family protein [Methylomirabilota bacterium]|nr:TVP38/TMEM64 family protein [Methylomirabilota bacterium]